MMQLTLDVVRFENETPELAIKELVGKITGLTWEILDKGGARPDWPYVRFTGDERALRQLVDRYGMGYPADLPKYLARMTPVSVQETTF